jgi:homocysteine S-methyltransferase
MPKSSAALSTTAGQRGRPAQSDMPLTILDGSMGHTLKQRGLSDSFAEAAYANLKQPELVTSVHQEFVAAGADVLTTNSFVITPFALAQGRAPWDPPAASEGPRPDELAALLHAAARCANEAAASATGRQVLVAGCLPPLATCYKPDEVGSEEEMLATYGRLVAELAPRVDLFLAETLTCASEARAALRAAAGAGRPCWLALSLRDAHDATLRGGERAVDIFTSLRAPPPAALLFNCCAPQSVTAALRALGGALPDGLRTGGYANGFRQTTSSWLAGGEEQYASVTRAAEYDADGYITPEAYGAHAAAWVEAGASVLGGCCGVGPEHIRTLAKMRDAEEHGG